MTLNNLKFEFSTRCRVETYVYWLYFDYMAQFDPNLTILTCCSSCLVLPRSTRTNPLTNYSTNVLLISLINLPAFFHMTTFGFPYFCILFLFIKKYQFLIFDNSDRNRLPFIPKSTSCFLSTVKTQTGNVR